MGHGTEILPLWRHWAGTSLRELLQASWWMAGTAHYLSGLGPVNVVQLELAANAEALEWKLFLISISVGRFVGTVKENRSSQEKNLRSREQNTPREGRLECLKEQKGNTEKEN